MLLRSDFGRWSDVLMRKRETMHILKTMIYVRTIQLSPLGVAVH